MTIIIARTPRRSTSGPLATSPTAAPATPKKTLVPMSRTRSWLVRAISGISASYGPPETVEKMANSSIVRKR